MSRRLHGWRKLAGSTWGPPDDPQFFGDLDIDAGTMLEYIELVRQRTGTHLTMTHLVGRAVAHALVSVPELRIRLARGREHARASVDVFFIVATEAGDGLSGIKVERADEKSAIEIAHLLTQGAQSLADGKDDPFARAKALLTVLPPRVLRYGLRLSAWVTSDLNLDLPAAGLRRQAFGGAMVTSIGMWGIAHAYSPLARYYRVPVLVCVGAVTQRPVAVAGRVVIRPVLSLSATFDHRYADGFHAAGFAHAIQEYCADPAACEPEPPALARRASQQQPVDAPSPSQESPVPVRRDARVSPRPETAPAP